MDTRSSGKQVATRITTVVAVGSLAVTGFGFVAVYKAPTSDAVTTSNGEDDDSSYASGGGQDDIDRTSDEGSTGGALQTPGVERNTARPLSKSTVSPVRPSSGGSVSGKSSGS